MKKRKAKSPEESCIETNHLVLPPDTNALGTIFGGTLLSWIDITAALCAQKHSERVAVTASLDAAYFMAPARLGDAVNLKARVTYTGKTSMEIAVRVLAWNPLEGIERHCVTAYLNFVALDKNHRPTAVPPLLLKTREDKLEYERAAERRKNLLKHRSRKP